MPRPSPKPSGNRPDTGNSFQNPVLGALRGRATAAPEESDSRTMVHFDGDFTGAGNSLEGAERMMNVVKQCFEAKGLHPQAQLMAEIAAGINGHSDIEHELMREISDNIRGSGEREFGMVFIFDSADNKKKIAGAVKEIIEASRTIQAGQTTGRDKGGK